MYSGQFEEDLAQFRAGQNADAVLSSPAYQAAKELVAAVLQFTAILLGNSINKHYYSSLPHISDLLGSRDEELAGLALEVVYLLSIPPPLYLQTRSPPFPNPGPVYNNKHLTRRVMQLAGGWAGGKSQVNMK